ncbi:hypothetical protein RSW42_03640, partial [Salmonella enterica]
NKTGPQSIHILRGVRQQQDEPGRFSICSRQAAVVPSLIKTVVKAKSQPQAFSVDKFLRNRSIHADSCRK